MLHYRRVIALALFVFSVLAALASVNVANSQPTVFRAPVSVVPQRVLLPRAPLPAAPGAREEVAASSRTPRTEQTGAATTAVTSVTHQSCGASKGNQLKLGMLERSGVYDFCDGW
jgi:hypothetical protein